MASVGRGRRAVARSASVVAVTSPARVPAGGPTHGPRVLSVNVASPRPNPHSPQHATGIDKRPVERIDVFAPGPRSGGAGSGVGGDFIGDRRHHGGDAQAVYAVSRADLDHYQAVLGRELTSGWMGENLTLDGLAAEQAIVGERWLVGTAELQVTCPRIPCSTFQDWAGRSGWVREFTAIGRCGTYLSVLRPGEIRPGDAVDVVAVPEHGITIQDLFWALTIRPELAGRVLAAERFLTDADRGRLERREVVHPT